jgi:hypothetical protein
MAAKKKKEKEDIDNDQINEEDTQRHLNLVEEVLENTQANIKRALKLLKERWFCGYGYGERTDYRRGV